MKTKGWIRGVLIALAICVGLGALAGAAVLTGVCVCAARRYEARPSDCIIVLGAHVWQDGTMCDALQRRCERALEAWQDGLAPAVIVCGRKGDDEPIAEAIVMRDWLTERGVPGERVFMDTASTNTRQNLENAKAVMAERGFATAAICTNDYHVRRALWLARDLDIDACALSAPSPRDVSRLVRSRLRESASWVLYFVRKLL